VGALYLAKEALASGEVKGTKKAIELLNSLDSQVYYMDTIVSDLQDYTRPVTTNLIETNLSDFVKEAISTLQIPENVEATIRIESDPTRALIDPVLLKRILVNLVLNAVQAMPNGGKLTITTHASEDSIIVSVQDTGVGIAADNLDKIFNPFFTTKAQGQGLGLAVCKRLIDAQGGTITVQSQLGKGSTFTIKIPTKQAAVAKTEQPSVVVPMS
jgi:signal transduction histidine kinase